MRGKFLFKRIQLFAWKVVAKILKIDVNLCFIFLPISSFHLFGSPSSWALIDHSIGGPLLYCGTHVKWCHSLPGQFIQIGDSKTHWLREILLQYVFIRRDIHLFKRNIFTKHRGCATYKIIYHAGKILYLLNRMQVPPRRHSTKQTLSLWASRPQPREPFYLQLIRLIKRLFGD